MMNVPDEDAYDPLEESARIPIPIGIPSPSYVHSYAHSSFTSSFTSSQRSGSVIPIAPAMRAPFPLMPSPSIPLPPNKPPAPQSKPPLPPGLPPSTSVNVSPSVPLRPPPPPIPLSLPLPLPVQPAPPLPLPLPPLPSDSIPPPPVTAQPPPPTGETLLPQSSDGTTSDSGNNSNGCNGSNGVSMARLVPISNPVLHREEDHAKRMESENKKRKLLPTAGSLRKVVGLRAFAVDDDDGDGSCSEGAKGGIAPSSNISNVASPGSTSTMPSVGLLDQKPTVSQDILINIKKTAQWVAEHPDMLPILMERSKGQPNMQFLYERHTPSGQSFLDELSRCKAEREVKDIFYGSSQHIPLASYLTTAVSTAASTAAQSTGIVNAATLEAAIARANAIAAASSAKIALANDPSRVTASQFESNTAGSSATSSASSSDGGDAVPTESKKKKSRWGEPPPISASSPISDTTSTLAFSAKAASLPTEHTAKLNPVTSLNPVKIKTSSAEAAIIEAETRLFLDSNRGDPTWAEKVRVQQEMQLLEARIRDAARGTSFSSSEDFAVMSTAGPLIATDQGVNSIKPTTMVESAALLNATLSAYLVPGSSHEALYLERLREYDDLARRYDADFKDTIEDAERNGGVIEGGTWEHRKRAREMLETAAKNLELTARSTGGHHMADFLPKAELDKFLRKAEALAAGGIAAKESDFLDSKITESNLGYQMLKNAGWVEGSGLGASSSASAILEPINMIGQTVAGAGVGVQATHELMAEDDDFDQYRKRMMLAYKFRPNPLNNPRRNYY